MASRWLYALFHLLPTVRAVRLTDRTDDCPVHPNNAAISMLYARILLSLPLLSLSARVCATVITCTCRRLNDWVRSVNVRMNGEQIKSDHYVGIGVGKDIGYRKNIVRGHGIVKTFNIFRKNILSNANCMPGSLFLSQCVTVPPISLSLSLLSFSRVERTKPGLKENAK